MDTTACGGKGQGKAKGIREGTIGQGGRGRKGGERSMGTTAYGGKGPKGRAANGNRPFEERLLDQAQARASYTPLFGGRSRSIPQCMVSNV